MIWLLFIKERFHNGVFTDGKTRQLVFSSHRKKSKVSKKYGQYLQRDHSDEIVCKRWDLRGVWDWDCLSHGAWTWTHVINYFKTMKRKFERYLGSTIKPKVSLRFSIPVGASLVDMYVDWLVHTLYSVNLTYYVFLLQMLFVNPSVTFLSQHPVLL